MKVHTRAKLRYLRMSPRKVRLLIDLIRGLSVKEARVQLQLSSKHAAKPVLKLLNSAVANATHNDNADPETLTVHRAMVDGGPILYRWMPRAFGRASKIRKRTSHITLILEGDAKETPAKKEKKQEEPKAEGAEEKKEESAEKKAPAKKPAAKKTTKKPAAKKKTTAKKAAPKKKTEKKEEKK